MSVSSGLRAREYYISPFRYPGGKSWFVPTALDFLKQGDYYEIVEPFLGGGNVALNALKHGVVKKATLVEFDPLVASVWEMILNNPLPLIEKILTFKPSKASVDRILSSDPQTILEKAFWCIIKNRMSFGGILHPNGKLIKKGYQGKGLKSCWFPETLCARIIQIHNMKGQITFIHGDAFDVLQRKCRNKKSVFFIDPPYVEQGPKLYNCGDIDHVRLFELTAKLQGDVLMTYDDAPLIRELGTKHGLNIDSCTMVNGRANKKKELILSNRIWRH